MKQKNYEKKSTFFPKSMSSQQVVDSINEAYSNKVLFHGNLYRGNASNGMPIEMAIDTNGKIITAYPMIYEYHPKEGELLDNYKFSTIESPEEIEAISIFLGSEMQNFGDWFLEEVESVLSGKERHRRVSGNCCVLDIKKRKTKVTYLYANDGNDEESCKIETVGLKELMLLWLEEESSG